MSLFSPSKRTAGYKPVLAWFCLFALVWSICLLYAGDFTTSIRAGMAFLDWPLSNGSIDPQGWLTDPDKMAEHSHRLIAMVMGNLTIAIGLLFYYREERRWLRRLAGGALLLVIFQGLLGGARVLFDKLNIMTTSNVVAQTFAVMHACTSQIFFCTLVALIVASSRSWIERRCDFQQPPPAAVKRWGLIACGALLLQLLIGAIMRHDAAGLAIPTFPLTSEGGLIPTYWTFKIGINFAHRVGALLVTVAILGFTGRIWGSPATRRALGIKPYVLLFLLALQVFLGALVIWSQRNAYVATIHALSGAFLLATTWMITFVCHRFSFDADGTPPARDAAVRHRRMKTNTAELQA